MLPDQRLEEQNSSVSRNNHMKFRKNNFFEIQEFFLNIKKFIKGAFPAAYLEK